MQRLQLLGVWERSCQLVISLHNDLVNQLHTDLGQRLSKSVIAVSSHLANCYETKPLCESSLNAANGALGELQVHIEQAHEHNLLPLATTHNWLQEVKTLRNQVEQLLAQCHQLSPSNQSA
ncbi:four helix bundle protein [Ferrimonas sp. YFM]|uniref:four helix bundle protein n=1 Tax=Ferrimonas sp. YFM TaxID=3028878 RepID=UPI0025729F69|nr:four helix bundle protein [Ferrimonas sp. YFM]BDY04100.1 hypothetical protein F0521_11410 [Ferrimonas sp. YFM]